MYQPQNERGGKQMKKKAILLDLDNTLYHYDPVHQYATESALKKLKELTGKTSDEIEKKLNKAKTHIKYLLPSSASGHSRILYFQRLLEELDITVFPLAHELSEIYWSSFLSNLSLTEDAKDFLSRCRDVSICLVTDLTAEIQYKKISKLGLDKYLHHIVTSEEAGVEKPHPLMFYLALNKVKLTSEEVIVVGDNFSKDIMGASNLGITSYWINRQGDQHKYNIPENCFEIRSLSEVCLNG